MVVVLTDAVDLVKTHTTVNLCVRCRSELINGMGYKKPEYVCMVLLAFFGWAILFTSVPGHNRSTSARRTENPTEQTTTEYAHADGLYDFVCIMFFSMQNIVHSSLPGRGGNFIEIVNLIMSGKAYLEGGKARTSSPGD